MINNKNLDIFTDILVKQIELRTLDNEYLDKTCDVLITHMVTSEYNKPDKIRHHVKVFILFDGDTPNDSVYFESDKKSSLTSRISYSLDESQWTFTTTELKQIISSKINIVLSNARINVENLIFKDTFSSFGTMSIG